MAREERSLYDSIMEDVNKSSGGNFADFFGLRDKGAKCRVRFLNDFNEGMPVLFHSKWEGYNHPCLTQYGKDCPNCGCDELGDGGRTITVYNWSVYNYETKKVELFSYKANKATPVPHLAVLFKELKSIIKQDIVITRNEKGQQTTYTLIPVGDRKPLGKDAKPFSKKKILKLLQEAFKDLGTDADDDEDYDDEEVAIKKPSKKGKPAKSKSRYDDDEDEDDEDLDDEDLDDEDDEDEIPAKKSKSKPKAKSKPAKKAKKSSRYDDDEDEDEDDDEPPFDADDEDDDDEEEELPPPKKRKRK